MVSIISYMRDIILIITLLVIGPGSQEGKTAYIYIRVGSLKVAGASCAITRTRKRRSQTRDEIEEQQVTVTLLSQDNESVRVGETLLCDPCFQEAIIVATSEATAFKSHISNLPCMNRPNVVTTRSNGHKVKLLF